MGHGPLALPGWAGLVQDSDRQATPKETTREAKEESKNPHNVVLHES